MVHETYLRDAGMDTLHDVRSSPARDAGFLHSLARLTEGRTRWLPASSPARRGRRSDTPPPSDSPNRNRRQRRGHRVARRCAPVLDTGAP
jgi:hypothetical protein